MLFTVALIVRGLAALPQMQPNYMDAAYYLAGGQRLVQGFGFNDAYIWHYLDHPTALPYPSHLYWMPLPSILVAISQTIFGVSYRSAQLPFVVLSACLPLIAYSIAWRVSASRRHAWLAALLTIFSPFYLPYWGVPESFAPFAVFGSLTLYLGSAGDKETSRQGLLAGVCAGLAHLSRADGFLLLVPTMWMRAQRMKAAPRGGKMKFSLHARRSSFILILIGYLLIMLPWFSRNVNAIGSPLSSAGAQMAWVCNYNELFTYNAHFDMNHLIGCGMDKVVGAKLNGVASGIVHLIAEDGMIFLAPLIAIGLWRKRNKPLFRDALIYLGLVFVMMMIVFTFAGDRGGLFHSTSALLPFFYAAAPIGLDTAVGWITTRRGAWNAANARVIFSAATMILAVTLSAIIYRGRVIGANMNDPIWNQADRVYGSIGQWLADRGEVNPIVMTNNPPDFYYQTQLRSIMIPNGPVDDLLSAARQFGATWIVLDENRPEPLAALYQRSTNDTRLRVGAQFNRTYVLQVIMP